VKSQLSKYLAKIGAKGGAAGRGKAKAGTPEVRRAAALKGWAKKKALQKGTSSPCGGSLEVAGGAA